MKGIKEISGLVLSTALLAGNPGIVWSADASLPQTIKPDLGVIEWNVSNAGGTDSGTAFSGTCDGSAGLVIDDATSADGAVDAYDKAWQVFINGQIFVAPGTVDITDNVMTAGPVLVDAANNLWGTVEYLFSDTVQAARIRVLLDNRSGNDINNITVEVPVNLGSDADTTIEATASGDNVFTVDDRWVITSDGGVPPSDPVNTIVIFGPDNPPVKPSALTWPVVFKCNDMITGKPLDNGEGGGVTFNVTIPSGSMRSLMAFAGLGNIEGTGNTVNGATRNVTQFDDPATIDASLVGDLSNTDWDETLNWRFIREGSVGLGNGGGGGCSLQTAGATDPSLPTLLAALSLLFIYRRSGRRQHWSTHRIAP